LVDRRCHFALRELAQGGALQIPSRFPVAVPGRTSTLHAASGGDQHCTTSFGSSHPASENPSADLVTERKK
jgi:hypothetical protein